MGWLHFTKNQFKAILLVPNASSNCFIFFLVAIVSILYDMCLLRCSFQHLLWIRLLAKITKTNISQQKVVKNYQQISSKSVPHCKIASLDDNLSSGAKLAPDAWISLWDFWRFVGYQKLPFLATKMNKASHIFFNMKWHQLPKNFYNPLDINWIEMWLDVVWAEYSYETWPVSVPIANPNRLSRLLSEYWCYQLKLWLLISNGAR